MAIGGVEEKGRTLEGPYGAVVNLDGISSIDPNDFYDGGALVAFGSHKGSGLSLLTRALLLTNP